MLGSSVVVDRFKLEGMKREPRERGWIINEATRGLGRIVVWGRQRRRRRVNSSSSCGVIGCCCSGTDCAVYTLDGGGRNQGPPAEEAGADFLPARLRLLLLLLGCLHYIMLHVPLPIHTPIIIVVVVAYLSHCRAQLFLRLLSIIQSGQGHKVYWNRRLKVSVIHCLWCNAESFHHLDATVKPFIHRELMAPGSIVLRRARESCQIDSSAALFYSLSCCHICWEEEEKQ